MFRLFRTILILMLASCWAHPHDTSITRLTQASNPANYRGWTTRDANMVTFFSPGTTTSGLRARDYLTASAQLSEFNVESLTGVWQGYFWNRSFIGTYGYRNDKARSYSFQTSGRGGNARLTLTPAPSSTD